MLARYQETEVGTASPVVLVVKLYAGMIRHLRLASEAIEARRPADRGRHISKAMAIVSELQCTLDLERGGEIAENLDRLYGFVTDRMLTANLDADTRSIDEALLVLEPLHSAWDEISRRPEIAELR